MPDMECRLRCFRKGRLRSHCSAARYQLDYQHHQGDQQQQVNEASKRVAAHHAYKPKNQQNHENCPKHGLTSMGGVLATESRSSVSHANTFDAVFQCDGCSSSENLGINTRLRSTNNLRIARRIEAASFPHNCKLRNPRLDCSRAGSASRLGCIGAAGANRLPAQRGLKKQFAPARLVVIQAFKRKRRIRTNCAKGEICCCLFCLSF